MDWWAGRQIRAAGKVERRPLNMADLFPGSPITALHGICSPGFFSRLPPDWLAGTIFVPVTNT